MSADDQVGLRGFDAGCDLIGIVLDESPFGESVGVEEEVPFEVREIRPAGGYLQPDLAGQGSQARRSARPQTGLG